MVAIWLATLSSAHATAFMAAPSASVVSVSDASGPGSSGPAFLPGVRLGFEPMPEVAVEFEFDHNLSDRFDAGLSLVGRMYPSARFEPGQGIFLVGHLTSGASVHSGDLGPWVTLQGGFGVRPVPALHIETTLGPDWNTVDGTRWRSSLTVGAVFPTGRSGGDTRHNQIREIPDA